MAVRKGEKVTVEIPVQMTGEATPDTLVDQQTMTLTVTADANALPEHLELGIQGKRAGSSLSAADVVVMRPDALRPAPATATAKLATRLSKDEKRNRKRMAEVGNRLRRHPAVRGPTDILPASDDQHDPRPARSPPTSGWWPAWSTMTVILLI